MASLQKLLEAANGDPSKAWDLAASRVGSRRATLTVEHLQHHVQEALADMAHHQHAILTALRSGETDTAQLKQPEYRAKERAYKGACRAQSEAHEARRRALLASGNPSGSASTAALEQRYFTGAPQDLRGHRQYPNLASYERAQAQRAAVLTRQLLPEQKHDLPSAAVAEQRRNDIAGKRPGNRGRGVLLRLEARKATAELARRSSICGGDASAAAVQATPDDLPELYPNATGGITAEPLQEEELRRRFREADVDNSGKVSVSELVTYMREQDSLFGVPHNPGDTERALRYTGGVGSRWRDPSRLRARLPGSTPDELPPPEHKARNPLPPVPDELSYDEFAAVVLAAAAR